VYLLSHCYSHAHCIGVSTCVATATEWAAFVKQKQREGTMDLKQQLENLQRQLKGYKTKKLVPHAKHSAAFSTTPHKASMSPDKPTPPPKPRRLHALAHSGTADSVAVFSNSIGHGTTSVREQSNAALRTESTGANAHADPKSGAKATTEVPNITKDNVKNDEGNDCDHSDDDSDGGEGGDELAEHESSKYHVAKTDYGQIQVSVMTLGVCVSLAMVLL
jgi:hypothetical protein